VTPPPGQVLSDRIALVTGGSSGIGQATVTHLLDCGARVVLLARAPDGGRGPGDAQRGSAKLTRLSLDLRDSGAIAAAVDAAAIAYDSLDIVINAAGTIGPTNTNTFTDVTVQRWQETFSVNALAPFLIMQAAARHMIAQGRGGRIVNVSSSSASRAVAIPDYAASKAALNSLTHTMAALGPQDINVNAVAGPDRDARTPLNSTFFPTAESYQTAVTSGVVANLLGRVSEPEDVASVIVFLCRPESRQITGQVIHTSAGLMI
jgi:NAD(P)-dependent dehydrogenase (short-subunit alcohol dehydrogenase family)